MRIIRTGKVIIRNLGKTAVRCCVGAVYGVSCGAAAMGREWNCGIGPVWSYGAMGGRVCNRHLKVLELIRVVFFDGPGTYSRFQYGKSPQGGPTCLQWNLEFVHPRTIPKICSCWHTSCYETFQKCGQVEIILARPKTIKQKLITWRRRGYCI